MAALFSCRACSATSEAKARRRVRADRLTIDIHCHAHVPEADAIAAGGFDPMAEPMIRHATPETREVNRLQMEGLRPRLTTSAARLADMDRLGIDIQVISPSPFQFHYWAGPDLGLELARTVNDGIAALAAAEPERFLGFGTVPLQAPELAVRELDRAVLELGFRGIEICTNVEGTELSDSRFAPFFARAEELGILLFLHPNGFTEGGRLTRHYFINLIGNPLDTSLAIAHLIFDGVLDSHPGLKICAAHGGGYLPAYAARMDHGWRARPDCKGALAGPPSERLRSIYFDTVVHSPRQLEYLVAEYGAGRILLGTDYPYDMADPDPLALLESANLSEADRAAIAGLNAARLLDLETEVPAAIDPSDHRLNR